MSKSINKVASLKVKMGNSIYEEASFKLNEIANHLTLKQWLEMISNIELIRKHLQEAYKQEKLLKLYRELMTVKDELISLAYYDNAYYFIRKPEANLEKQIKELEKQIKELENDKKRKTTKIY